MLRTFDEIMTDGVAYLIANTELTVEPGSVARDMLAANAQEFETDYVEITRIQDLAALVNPEDHTEEEIDLEAANCDLTRLPGTPSTTYVVFRIANFTAAEAAIPIPAGTQAGTNATLGAPSVEFATTISSIFDPGLAGTYYNPNSGFFEVTVPVQSSSVGVGTRTGSGTIVRLISPIPKIAEITNILAASDGIDKESNTDLVNRIKVKKAGSNIGTPAGLESTAREFSGVLDVQIAKPGDAEMVRDEFPSAVDIFIQGEQLTDQTDTLTYGGETEFVMLLQPAKSVSSVVGIMGGLSHTFVQGVDFSFVEDTGELLGGSTRALSVLRWLGVNVPDMATTFDVTYAYDKLMVDLQNVYDADDANIICSDILVREALKVEVDISTPISILPGYDFPTVSLNVVTALTTYLNAALLDDDIDQSDIVAVISGVSGVDSVEIASMVVLRDAVPVTDVSISKQEYARPNTISITLA